MIPLYETQKTLDSASRPGVTSATTVVVFGFSVDVRRFKLFGVGKVSLYNVATIAAANAAAAAGTRPAFELNANAALPRDEIICNVNEIMHFSVGCVAIGSGTDANTYIKAYTMGNPVGSQGSV